MISDQQEFLGLFSRLRAGDAAAAPELVEKYGPYLLRVVRQRLHRKLRPKFDSQDFVQDVWAAFFAHLPNFGMSSNPENLIAFLEALARNRVAEVVRDRMIRAKYNVNREQKSINDSTAGLPEPAARQATPSTVAMSREEWERLLRSQPRVYRHILVLRHAGKSLQQIAGQLGLSERTVRRVVDKLLPGSLS